MSVKPMNWDTIRLNLQQVMVQPSSIWDIDEESKLSGTENFFKWQGALAFKLRTRGLHLYEYMVHGTTPPCETGMISDVDQDEMRSLLSSCVTSALLASVKGHPLMFLQIQYTANDFKDTGHDLFNSLKEQFGYVSLSMVWRRILEITQKGSSKSCDDLLSQFFELQVNVLNNLSPQELGSCLLVASLKNQGVSECDIEQIATTYLSKFKYLKPRNLPEGGSLQR